jgi:uncharacterized protein (TIGR00106 family)
LKLEHQVIAEVKIIPLGTQTTSLSRYVKACTVLLKDAKNITFQTTAMGTVIQGRLDHVLELVQKMHEIPFTMGSQRVLTTITIDDRRDKEATIESKIKAVTG